MVLLHVGKAMTKSMKNGACRSTFHRLGLEKQNYLNQIFFS